MTDEANPTTPPSSPSAPAHGRGRGRGRLKVLLGAAPGVGKTYAMLDEGRRRAARGTDVVVGLVETHDRPETAALLAGLEVVPRRRSTYRGMEVTEMDLDAVLRRHPQVALVDELAHTNAPGSRHARRWEDVEELLAAGIEVITTVNVQHLESFTDVVQQITDTVQRERIPDEVVRSADQIELVDLPPESLRARMSHGNIYPLDKVDAALRHYFRPGNLAALRELALLWVADRVEAGLADYRRTYHIEASWPTRERMIVALSGGAEGKTLIRRAARLAQKGTGGELLAVHVAHDDGLVSSDRQELVEERTLVEDLSGTFHTLTGEDPAQAILDFARSVNATQIVIGARRGGTWQRLLRRTVSQAVIADSGDIDVHVVSHSARPGGSPYRTGSQLTRLRRLLGLGLAIVLPIALTALLSALPPDAGRLIMPAYLAVTTGVAIVGGWWPAAFAAILGALLDNWFFTSPIHTLVISDPWELTGLVLNLLVGWLVAFVVERAILQRRRAASARTEADTLFLLSADSLSPGFSVRSALDKVREAFGLASVMLRERGEATSPWRVIASSGPPADTAGTDTEITLADGRRSLTLRGGSLTASDERVITAYAGLLEARLEREQLREQAAEAAELSARDSFQTALLAAVSHDLRTPLSAIKLSASSLAATDLEWSDEDRREFVDVIDVNADRLDALISNLLDMTRLRTGHLRPVFRWALVDEFVPPVASLHEPCRVAVPSTRGIPMVWTDPGLVERILGNVVDNALRHEPGDRPVEMTARVVSSPTEDRVEIRVADHGPGVPPEHLGDLFRPFQRFGDTPGGKGLGLGLAVAEGFARAIGATLRAEQTPGGGLTMVISLPLDEQASPNRNGDASGAPVERAPRPTTDRQDVDDDR